MAALKPERALPGPLSLLPPTISGPIHQHEPQLAEAEESQHVLKLMHSILPCSRLKSIEKQWSKG